jgi:MarR family
MREENLEFSVERSFEDMGMFLLSEWDVLAFLSRHGTCLTSIDQIARLTGCEGTVVSAALDRLEREMLIERSRPSLGVCLYRVLTLNDPERERRLQHLLALWESRGGRLALSRLLKPVDSQSSKKGNRLEFRKGNAYA